MKKLITKFWGLAIIVTLLASLFVAAVPVSANALQYSADNMPNSIGAPISAGTQILDMAINGDTIYVANGANNPAGVPPTFGLRKSTNGGASFVPVTVAPAGVPAANIDMVAVAPDDANFVVAIDITSATDVVYVSTNGGSSWSNIGAPRDSTGTALTTVNDVDISVTFQAGHYIGVAGTTGAPRLAIFNTAGGLGTGWYDAISEGPNDNGNTYAAAGGTGTSGWAIKFSPSFPGDLTAVFVTQNATDANFEEVQFTGTGDFNTFPGYPVVVTGAGAAAGAVTKADIALFPDYFAGDETLRNAFVALTAAGNNGLFRLNDTIPATKFTSPTGLTGLNSVAYDGTTVIVGSYDSNIVAFSNAPLAVGATAILTADRVLKRSGINQAAFNDQVVVGIIGTNIVSGKRGAESAFAVSTDGGLTFNDIALVNSATGRVLTDIAYNADATKKYALTDSGNATSVWYFNTSWKRVLTLDRVTYLAGWIVRPAPENFDCVYIGNTGATDIFYSTTAGANWNTKYAAPGNINDIAVESADVIYVATAGTVAKSVNHAFYFGALVAPSSTWTGVVTVKSYGANKILATSNDGKVQWSLDGGTTWQTILAPAALAAGGNTYAVADKLEAGGNIYAVSALDANVYRWTIGTSAVWTAIGGPAAAPPSNVGITATYLSTDIALVNGVVYRLGTDGAQTEVSRSLNPSAPAAVAWTSIDTTGAGTTMAAGLTPATGGAGNAVPNALKMVGNIAYFIDTVNNRVLANTDTLAAPTAVPALATPANEGLVQTNPATGASNPVTFMWNAVAGGQTYQIATAQDSAFFQPVAAASGVQGFMVTNLVVAANTFAPGQTYYWRVRVATPYLSNWSEVRTFRVQPNTAVVPAINSPANGSILSGAAAFSWTPTAGAASYKFELDTGTTFTAPMYSVEATSAGVMLPPTMKLEAGKTYFWRVKALKPIEGDWSTVANFTVAVPPTTPPPTTPAPVVTPTITITQPQATTTTIVMPTPEPAKVVNPSYIWAIIIIGAVLVIAVIILIVRTRRSV